MKSMRWGHLLKRGRAGQSIVILALGFVALLAFVGIVTDVSLLFVRYSTLRRAVDAAAVAAATQMRRIENTSTTAGVDTGGSTSVANMNLAARQFLNLYSLDPSDVTVETCNAQLVAWQDSGADSGQPTFQGIYDDHGRQVVTPLEQEKRYNEVCKDGRKLVRVTASIKSPTVFLRMLGMQDVTLTVSSISETAVLDVALVLDVSESMLQETTYADYETQLGHPVARILPGRAPQMMSSNGNSLVGNTQDMLDWWTNITAKTQAGIDGYVSSNPTYTLVTDEFTGETKTFRTQPIARYRDSGGNLVTVPTSEWNDTSAGGAYMLRADCRTRFWPNAYNLSYGAGISTEMYADYKDLFFNQDVDERDYFKIPTGVALDPTNSTSAKFYKYAGWLPEYDFYGCCNDPNGDGDFSDLSCQPMRQARDASQDFLRRIDFPRGDAVAIVTFSQNAQVISPTTGGDPWIRGNETLAEQVLTKAVGVRAEQTYYTNNTGDYGWDAFNIGNSSVAGTTFNANYNYWNNTTISSLTYYPVHNNCPFDMATLTAPYYPAAGYVDGPLLYGIQTPDWLTSLGLSQARVTKRSYDYRGSCRDTNVGGALQASGNVFSQLGQSRTEGSVWVMVLMSDGAAGASNAIVNSANPHVKSNGEITYQQRMSNPYGYDLDSDGVAIRDSAVMTGLTAEYGSFGFCPYGTNASADTRGELVLNDNFPYCSDVYPNSRHSCATTESSELNPPNNPVYLDLNPGTNSFSCAQNYDVDDYARDWADYIAGVTEPNVSTKQLPVIFTIGFNLTYPNKTGCETGDATADAACLRSKNTESYLGEELLRYIADTGDNFRMDDDFWQWRLGKLGVFTDPDTLSPSQKETFYGEPGPCEIQTENPITTPPSQSADLKTDNHQMLTPGEDCGNYFNAPGQTELAEVFNEIASRMFTRLSQ